MEIVVIGGTGLVGSKLVAVLAEQRHHAVAASRAAGVDTVTGEGLSRVLAGADVVVDVSNSPSPEGAAALAFFETSTRTLLGAEAAAGVGHHVILSVVGAERVPDSGYLVAKVAQEALGRHGPIPCTIVRATQFFEFIGSIADAAADGDTVRLPPVHVRPVAADDVAHALARVAVGAPLAGVVEVAGPQELRLDELVRDLLQEHGDDRTVVTDPRARYFGAQLDERALVPEAGAQLGETTLEDWRRRRSDPS